MTIRFHSSPPQSDLSRLSPDSGDRSLITLLAKPQGAFGQGVLAGLLCILVGCASDRPPSPLPAFQSIALLGVSGSRESLHADSTAAKAVAGASGGAAGGAATGAAIGLACGPLALFCIPVGIVVGGVTGAAAGGITQGGKGLSRDNSRRVNDLLQKQQPGLDIHERLYTAVRSALPADRQSDDQDAEAVAALRVTRIELRQHSNERVSSSSWRR